VRFYWKTVEKRAAKYLDNSHHRAENNEKILQVEKLRRFWRIRLSCFLAPSAGLRGSKQHQKERARTK
jgi:hypothetical protein